MNELITKTEERIVFLNEWISAIEIEISAEVTKSVSFLRSDNFYEKKNKIFQLEQEIDSRTMYLKTLKQDMALKRMDAELPNMIEAIDKSKLSKELAPKFDGLKKRVKQNKYINAKHKAQDYDLALQMVQS